MRKGTGALVAFVLLACDGASSAPHRGPEDAGLPPVNAMGSVADAAGFAAHATGSDADAMGFDAGAVATGLSQEASAPPDDAATLQLTPMACDVDASDEASADYCPPPLSICADNQHLAYFDWGTCVAGWCVWPDKIMACPSFGRCVSGACISSLTAPP
jgi:hypothetical protein